MGYGFARARGARVEQLGFSGAGSTTTVIASATAGTFGTLATLGTSSFAYDAITLSIGIANQKRGILTLTANTGGSDQTIADSIAFNNVIASNDIGTSVWLPLRVPSGAVIKAKTATTASGGQLRVAVTGIQSGALSRGFGRVVSCTDFTGADPTNPITLNGTTLTGWVQVQAATPADIGMLFALPTCTTTAGGPNGQIYVEIGWGASGSEIPLVKVPIVVNNTFVTTPICIPCVIPQGTRIAARAQCSVASTVTVGVVCWGAQP
ncbi:MAG TPA: hypothetical protein VGF34_00855 [Stellaceae bacterium]|jgi:hypothetical protein